jgi:hypothetical protein
MFKVHFKGQLFKEIAHDLVAIRRQSACGVRIQSVPQVSQFEEKFMISAVRFPELALTGFDELLRG